MVEMEPFDPTGSAPNTLEDARYQDEVEQVGEGQEEEMIEMASFDPLADQAKEAEEEINKIGEGVTFGKDNAEHSDVEMIEEPEIIDDTSKNNTSYDILQDEDLKTLHADNARRNNVALTIEDTQGYWLWMFDKYIRGTTVQKTPEGDPIDLFEDKRGSGADIGGTIFSIEKMDGKTFKYLLL